MRYAALIVAIVGILISTSPAISGESDALAKARTLTTSLKHAEAAEVLEDYLPRAQGAEHAVAVSMLREAYGLLAKQADEQGRPREAELYRDNLSILNHELDDSNRTNPASQTTPPSTAKNIVPPTTVPSVSIPKQGSATPIKEPVTPIGVPPVRENGTTPAVEKNVPLLESPADDGQSLPAPERLPKPASLPPPDSRPTRENSNATQPLPQVDRSPASQPRANASLEAEPSAGRQEQTPLDPNVQAAHDKTRQLLSRADECFQGKKYEEAGKIYGQLAASKELPTNRNEVWAYCRWYEILKRMNAKPRSAKEWDAIEAEIQSVRRLVPNNWYSDYLMSKLAESRKSRRSLFPSRSRNEKLLVRGSEPEEVEVNLAGDRSEKQPALKAAPREQLTELDQDGNQERAAAPVLSPSPKRAPARNARPTTPTNTPNDPEVPAAEASPATASAEVNPSDRWQIRETPNFRIFHHAPEVAERAAQVAESVRAVQSRRWIDAQRGGQTWAPKCDIYLYTDAPMFAKMTGQAETSPGFTMMGANSGRIISRRVNLRADHPQMISAILPHEVTHVVLADLFPDKPIPRWADEGMAVLSEPQTEQLSRVAELDGPLRENRVFSLDKLTSLDTPDANDWPVYYAQSVSLTRYLVDQGNPRDFIRFVQISQRSGYDTALQSVYRIESLAALQEQWTQAAREQSAPPIAKGPGTAAEQPSPGQAKTEVR